MTLLRMYDAAYPPKIPPAADVAAGYIGGDTPHVWTQAEWAGQPAPFRLPIFTASNRTDDAGAAGRDAWAINHALGVLKVPHGCMVAVDLETAVYSTYLSALSWFLHGLGYPLLAYGSVSTLERNPLTSGGRWAAHWTTPPAVADLTEPGVRAWQYAGSATSGGPYDLSVIEDTVPLWRAG